LDGSILRARGRRHTQAPVRSGARTMSDDPLLENKAFSFIRVAPRSSKPRESGLTIVADRGMGPRRAADLLESAGDYIDVFKIAIGAWRLQSEAFLQSKIRLLSEHGVRAFFAGDATEAAIVQGVADRFYETVKRLGADAVEVSSAQIALPVGDKCRLVELAGRKGLQVVAEAGRKGAPQWAQSTAQVQAEIEALRDAGAWKVLVQGEGIVEGVDERRYDLLVDVAARFPVSELIFQAKDSEAQEWFVTTFGHSVNLDIDDHQVLDVELMRRGMRKRGVFGLVAGALEQTP
ncbi:MAG: phosphosulfolactate synthase, partial [Gammaproteobacteria bacterium]